MKFWKRRVVETRPILDKDRVEEIVKECGGSYAAAYQKICEESKSNNELPNVTWGGWFTIQAGLVKEMRDLILEAKGGK